MPDASTAIERLRAATGAVHQDLDRSLVLLDRLSDAGSRVDMMRRYHRLQAAVEAAVAPYLQDIAALQFADRSHAPAMAAALRLMGEATVARVAPAPEIGSRAAALGALYVLEGSSLGGRMILRDLRGRGLDTSGLEFLDPYGARTGAMWRALLAVLERELAAPAAITAACEAAVATFALARACLSDTTTTRQAA